MTQFLKNVAQDAAHKAKSKVTNTAAKTSGD